MVYQTSEFRLRSKQVWTMAGAALILAATVVAYLPAMHGEFIWDDDLYVSANSLLHDLEGLKQIWIPTHTPQYYPVVFTSFWIEYQFWQVNPMGYHIVNVVLHALNALLVWRLCTVLNVPGGLIAGWLIAAIFALHPVHVESVAWITERKNVLSGFFYLTAALAYLKFDSLRNSPAALTTKDAEPPTDRPRRTLGTDSWGWYGLSLVLFVLALLSKSVTCSLPAALVLMMLWQRKPPTVARLAPLAPMFVFGVVLALHTAHIEREHVGAEGDDFLLSWIDRILIASNALLFYPHQLMWPAKLMFVYPRWQIDVSSVNLWLAVAGVVAIGAASVILYRRGWRGPALALAFYAGTILPALGFVNIYPMRFSFVADHFQYLASLGVIALVIGGLAHLALRPKALAVVAVAVLPILFALTWQQAGTYFSAEAVFLDTLSKNDAAWMPHNNLGNLLIRRDPVAAERHYRRALQIKPDHYPAQSNLAEALRMQGRHEESIAETTESIRQIRAKMTDPNAKTPRSLARELHRLGRSLQAVGRVAEAEAAFTGALAIDDGAATYHASLAQFLMRQDRADEAVDHFIAASERDNGDWSSMRSAAVIRSRQNRYDEAAIWFEKALAAAPSLPEYTQVAPPLIHLLASCPDPEQRDPARAIQLAEQLCSATRWSDPAALDVLADVYAETDRLPDALRTAERALELARPLGLSDLTEMITQHVEEYRRRLKESGG